MNREALSFNPAATNRHPVDQLANVRECIKNLKEREDELRTQIAEEMGARDSLGGDEFIARQTVTERKGALDEKALKAAGIDTDRFRKPATTVYAIRLDRRVIEEAA